MNSEILESLVRDKIHFGKYKGRTLCDLPISYLEWFAKKGFPNGKLGMQLATLYEIRLNGLDDIITQTKRLKHKP